MGGERDLAKSFFVTFSGSVDYCNFSFQLAPFFRAICDMLLISYTLIDSSLFSCVHENDRDSHFHQMNRPFSDLRLALVDVSNSSFSPSSPSSIRNQCNKDNKVHYYRPG